MLHYRHESSCILYFNPFVSSTQPFSTIKETVIHRRERKRDFRLQITLYSSNLFPPAQDRKAITIYLRTLIYLLISYASSHMPCHSTITQLILFYFLLLRQYHLFPFFAFSVSSEEIFAVSFPNR